MKEIKLTRGYVAMVDDKDYELLNSYKWQCQKTTNSDLVYASRSVKINGLKKKVLMHRQIMGVTDEKILVDHKDNNPLNNQSENLRLCSKKENQKNVRVHKDNVSGFIGVSWRPSRNKYRARIFDNGKEVSLGHFENAFDAAVAYNAAAVRVHGEFANLNKV